MSDIRMGSRAVIDSPAQRAAAVGNADAEADRFAASEETEPPNIATQPSHEVSNYLAVSRKYPPSELRRDSDCRRRSPDGHNRSTVHAVGVQRSRLSLLTFRPFTPDLSKDTCESDRLPRPHYPD